MGLILSAETVLMAALSSLHQHAASGLVCKYIEFVKMQLKLCNEALVQEGLPLSSECATFQVHHLLTVTINICLF